MNIINIIDYLDAEMEPGDGAGEPGAGAGGCRCRVPVVPVPGVALDPGGFPEQA
jgi:hypothetical protein